MPSDLFPFSSFDFNGIQGGYNGLLGDSKNEEILEPALKRKQSQDQMFAIEELGLQEINRSPMELCGAQQEKDAANKGLNFFKVQNHMMHEQQHQQSDIGLLQTQSIQMSIHQELAKPAKETRCGFASSTTLELLSTNVSGSKRLSRGSTSQPAEDETNKGGRQKLSTEEIMRVAGTRYIHFSDQRFDDLSMMVHPYGYALAGLSDEETRYVELVHLLLAAAEKVSYQQYERASRLLSNCEWIASEGANSVQRVVYYFVEALRGRIDKETGRITVKEFTVDKGLSYHGLGYNVAFLKCYQKLPFNQVMDYAAIQSILDTVANARKIHVIDLQIRSGVHWTALMQALAERVQRPVQLLKITAFGLKIQERDLEKVGEMLSSFAESLNIPFSFNIVCVSCFMETKPQLFHILNDETLVVYSSLILRVLLSWPSSLENLLGVIKRLNPVMMVVAEIEANHNSPSFVNRFTEALFFYSALFDSLETCLGEDTTLRATMEETLKEGIHNIVALEGTERIARSVKIDVWRAFFKRFRMVEVGFSNHCLYQANLLIEKFSSARFWSFESNGKSLIIAWKGTPIHSLSLWKFPRERGFLFRR